MALKNLSQSTNNFSYLLKNPQEKGYAPIHNMSN